MYLGVVLLQYIHTYNVHKHTAYQEKELLDASIWLLLAHFVLVNVTSYFQACTEHSTVDKTERSLETKDYNSRNGLHLQI